MYTCIFQYIYRDTSASFKHPFHELIQMILYWVAYQVLQKIHTLGTSMWKPLVCTGINMDKLLPTSAECRYIFSYISIRSACDFTQAALGGSLYQAVMATAIDWTWVVELQFSLVLLLLAKKNVYKSLKQKMWLKRELSLVSENRDNICNLVLGLSNQHLFFPKVRWVAFHYTKMDPMVK